MGSSEGKILLLDPSTELVFRGPFNEVVTSHLHLHNPIDETVLFNVKTTAPRHYCVRPNKGVLGPNSKQDVFVMLQPFDPNSIDKSKHKFMVQYMISPPDFSHEQLHTIWKTVTKSQLMVSDKLQCVFIEDESEKQAKDLKSSNQIEEVEMEKKEELQWLTRQNQELRQRQRPKQSNLGEGN